MASIASTQLQEQLPGAAFVEQKLHRAWRKERHFLHTRGFCFFALWAAALVLLDLVVDFVFRVPGYWRLVLVAINVGAIAWVLYDHWLRYLHHYDPVVTALKVEGRHPELQSLLVSFVQFRGGPREGSYVSPSLLRALRRQTIEYTQPIDFREIVSYRELKRISIFSACVLAVFGFVSINWSGHLRALVRRFLYPEAKISYPTATQILAIKITGNGTIQQGKEVVIEAWAGGKVPRRRILAIQQQAGAWEQVGLLNPEQNYYTYRFPEVYQSFQCRVSLGDASSETYQITVVPPPRIVKTEVLVKYPDYTGQRPQTFDILNLEVPEGTKLQWQLRCDQALRSAAVLREDAASASMKLSRDGLVASFETVATESFDYSFQWKEDKHGYEYKDEVKYFVQVIPDSAPQVEIVRPLEDEKATVRKTLTVTYNARDDYGLAEACIAYNVNDGEEKRFSLGTLKGKAIENKDATWVLKKSISDLKEGDVVTYAVEVADNHTGEGGAFRTKSQGRRLQIVSDEEYLRYLAERRRKLIADIKTMHTQETEAAEKVGEIESKKPD
ncbi:MAG: DUF4175 domain-containing protein [Planctomycetes bacterium]|nr:DUF4175 domain-containing protein [Planctomycetota bacterium]